MASDNPRRNFILGAGEQLVANVPPPPLIPKRATPYGPEEAKERLRSRLEKTIKAISDAPEQSLVNGEAVAALTLHPQFLSKSAFPSNLLARVGMRAIGSKPDRVVPEKVDRKDKQIREEPTSTLFVAGTKQSFEAFSDELALPIDKIEDKILDDFSAIAECRALLPADRISVVNYPNGDLLQCALFADSQDGETILSAFSSYAEAIGFEVDLENELFSSGMCFVGARGPEARLTDLAWFSMLRDVRSMPTLRPLIPSTVQRSFGTQVVELPSSDPLDENLKAAVFDVPLPAEHCLGPWVTDVPYIIDAPLTGESALHGLYVTSGALFGPLSEHQAGLAPYRIDHHGVLGRTNNFLGNLKSLRKEAQGYKLINISFGPDEAIIDGSVHPFTLVIDELAADGERLVFVAAGNAGTRDAMAQLNRVQPPSDAVNAISVGAANSRTSSWARANYSCVGPGRLGCRVKPDLVAFGGSKDEPFGCVGPGSPPVRHNTDGTSFASPAAMRTAGTIMATMGEQITPIGIKAVMLSAAKQRGHQREEVGHGLIEENLQELLTSDDCEAKILFQGFLEAGKHKSHEIPLPAELSGIVEIGATLCYSTPVDDTFAASYVQAGVEARFRPHSQRFGKQKSSDGSVLESQTVRSQPLFNQRNVYGEPVDRRDTHLWETVLKANIRKRHDTLHQPTVELHYNRRVSGQQSSNRKSNKIPYALVITIRCKGVLNLYDQICARYGSNLIRLRPRLEIQIQN